MNSCMRSKFIWLCFILGLSCSVSGEVGDIKFSGTYDIQYRGGDSYTTCGGDRFQIMDLYFQINPTLANGVEGLLKLDGADMSKETNTASHKYVEEAQIIFKNVAKFPLTVVFGKDEMPFGQDYDKSLYDPLVHQLEIDKVWGLNAGYKFSDLLEFEAGIWEQDSTKDLSICESYTTRIKFIPVKSLTAEISYANVGNDTGKDETRVSIGGIYKFQKLVFYLEYNSLNENKTKINGYTLGEKPVLITCGADYMLNTKWKVKVRYEGLNDDDSTVDTIQGACQLGVDYRVGEKTALMLEYQNTIGEGVVEDKGDIAIGVKAKF